MLELFSTTTFEGRLKNNSWLYNKQRNNQKKKKQREQQLHVFPRILKEKKHDKLFSKSKKSLLRNIKSDLNYIF